MILTADVITTLARHRQTKTGDTEAGGMLFARISPRVISIEEATAPQPKDRRSRFSFWPHNASQQRTINERFRDGLHFVGEWHTHPELRPHPSGLDLASMEKCYRESRHELRSLVMVIVGIADDPAGLWVSLHDHRGYRQLRLQPEPSGSERQNAT